jgi:GH24 family phage-related lysozyme (muramidase)
MIAEPIRAGNFIAFFESYRSVAYWDVNAWRVGYGSDTEGPQGVPVVQGSTTTPDRALANLRLRLTQFEAGIVNEIGEAAWRARGTGQQCAGLSFMYNYGRLTVGNVATAFKSGVGIAFAISMRANDNKGENAKRRYAEAAMAASDGP